MPSFTTKFINKFFVINFLFSLLIASFIAGNLVLNLNVLLIIIFSLIFFKKNVIPSSLDNFDKILILFFVYILINGLLNNIFYLKTNIVDDFSVLLKSIFFFRFLIFYFVIKYLIKENILNLKFFFIIKLPQFEQ